MDNFADERDFALLEKDKYTFFVLRRILDGGCELLLTDHETLILCFSCDPFPVWVWTADGASQAEMERAYKEAMSRPQLNGKLFNMKYDLANYFIKRAAEDGKPLSIRKNMFAYDCPNPIKPTQSADGCLLRCGADDMETLTNLIEEFHAELKLDTQSRERYRMEAEQSVATGNTFFWKDGRGEVAACCRFTVRDDTASLSLVYTRPAFRRKHYAQNMVYEVTKLVKKAGYIPMLYTDADYPASNACYEKIGYILRGKLCTIG